MNPKNIIRVELNVDRINENTLSVFDGLAARIWAGTGTKVQVALFKGRPGSERLLTADELGLYEDITFGVFAISRTGLPFVEKTIGAADVDNTLTEESWEDGSGQHLEFDLAPAEMELPVDVGQVQKSYWWVITANAFDATFGGGELLVVRDRDAIEGPLQAGNLIPSGAVYDESGEYLLSLTPGLVLVWEKGANDTALFNDTQAVSLTNTVFTVSALGGLLLTGTADAPVTAALRANPFLPVQVSDARYLRGRVGFVLVDNGASSVTVAGLALNFVPQFVLCTMRIPANGLLITAAVRADSISFNGFTADLSAETDSGSYRLDFIMF